MLQREISYGGGGEKMLILKPLSGRWKRREEEKEEVPESISLQVGRVWCGGGRSTGQAGGGWCPT